MTTVTVPSVGQSPGLDEIVEAEPGSITLLQRLEKELARWPLARLTTVGPRTTRWAIETVFNSAELIPGAPRARMTAQLLGQVAMDEAVMALVRGPSRTPRRSDYQRVATELEGAVSLFAERGWLDDPASYHEAPPPMDHVEISSGWALGQCYRRLSWNSGFEARPGVPGADRWGAFEANRTASAWVLEHDDGPRPWVVAVHGFGTGAPFADLLTFRAWHLHHHLGWNVAAIVLPVHGSRRESRIGGEQFLGFDLVNCLHALTQSVWDVRRLLSWVRDRSPSRIVLHGVSLGAYVAALTTCFDGDLDGVVAGIPVSNFPALLSHHLPQHVRDRAAQHRILSGNAEVVHRVVNPLAMPTLVAAGRRFVFAGLGDRMSPPQQARALWEHWDRPNICWFPGNHVGYLWSDKVGAYVDTVLLKAASLPSVRAGGKFGG